MLHSFDVVMNHVLIETEQRQEIGEELVSSRNVAGERFAGSRQDEPAIFFVLEETIGIEPLDHVGDAGLRNLEPGRDVDDARISLGIDEIQDPFEIILDCGRVALGIFPGGGHGSARLTPFRVRSK